MSVNLKSRDICDYCKGEIVLRLGTKKVKPYWAHVYIGKCSLKNLKQSIMLKNVRKLILNKLNEGCVFIFEKMCNKCNKTIKTKMPNNSVKFLEEYVEDNKVIFDIVGLSSLNNVTFGINIGKFKIGKNDIPWFEITIDEIINKLDNNDKSITFLDQRLHQGCESYSHDIFLPFTVNCPPLPPNYLPDVKSINKLKRKNTFTI